MKIKPGQDFFRIGKVRIFITSTSDAIQRIKVAITNRQTGYVCISNMRTVVIANTDDSYHKVMENSLFNTPDGTPLVWCGKLWGLKKVQRACGPHIFEAMLKDKKSGLKHFFLGDTEETLSKLREKCAKDYGTNIVGSFSPPFKPLEEYDVKGIAQMINESGANIVWTSLRAPKQDYLGALITPYLKEGVIVVGVGAAYRYILGEYNQPDGIMQKLGLAGFFFRKGTVPLSKQIRWYIKHSLYLLKFSLSIIWKRIIGCDYWV